jgi:hypothetical protein
MPTLASLVPFIVETPLRTSLLAYSRHANTNVYVTPTMVFSKSTSIIHVVIVAHLPSCRDRVVCGPHLPICHVSTLSCECVWLLTIVLILGKHNTVIVMTRKVRVQYRRSDVAVVQHRSLRGNSLTLGRKGQRRDPSVLRAPSSRFNNACPLRVPCPNRAAR